MGRLKQLIDQLKGFSNNEEIRNTIEEIGKFLLEENRFKIEALIEIGDVDKNELDIGGLEYGEDYEILTGRYIRPGGNEYTEEEREDRIEELEEEIQNLEDKKMRLHGRAYELVDDKQTRVNDELQELEDAEYEYDEIYWNTVWNYEGRVNKALAQRLGMGVLEFRNGQEYMFLTRYGMDLSPLLYAYQALELGYVEEDAVRKFRDPKYFKYLVGFKTFKEICDVLGITDCIETAIEEQERRMKEFDEKIKKITELRDSDPVLGQIAGLALMAQTMTEM